MQGDGTHLTSCHWKGENEELRTKNNIFIDENKVISIIIALRRDSLRPADMDAARLSELCVGA